MGRIAVGDVMTRNFVSVRPDTNLLKCAKQMVRSRVDSLLITQGNRLRGILTSTDILWAITKKTNIDLKTVRAVDVATKKVAVIKPSSDISQALRKMRSYNFRRLPVLAKGDVIGVITLKDILKIDPSLYSELGQLMDIKEEVRKLKQTGVEWPAEGLCENCGAFAELLKVYDQLLCPDCREELY
jgi:CBS domain-containing protein